MNTVPWQFTLDRLKKKKSLVFRFATKVIDIYILYYLVDGRVLVLVDP
jgi:hypothetical protein